MPHQILQIKINNCEDVSIETIQNEIQRDKDCDKLRPLVT